MPRSVVPVVLDNRVQHLGRMYVNNLRAAHRLPLSKSDSMFPNHYTSVRATTMERNPNHKSPPAPLPKKKKRKEKPVPECRGVRSACDRI